MYSNKKWCYCYIVFANTTLYCKNILNCYTNAWGTEVVRWGSISDKSTYILNDKYKDLGNLTYSYILRNSNDAELYMYIPDIYSGVDDNKSLKIGIDVYITYFSSIGKKIHV